MFLIYTYTLLTQKFLFGLNLLYVPIIDYCSNFMYSMNEVFCTMRVCMFVFFVPYLIYCLGYRRHVYELNILKTTSGIVSQFSVYPVLYCYTYTSPHVPSITTSLSLPGFLSFLSLLPQLKQPIVISVPPSLPHHFFQYSQFPFLRFRLQIISYLSFIITLQITVYTLLDYSSPILDSYRSFTTPYNSIQANPLVSFPPLTQVQIQVIGLTSLSSSHFLSLDCTEKFPGKRVHSNSI